MRSIGGTLGVSVAILLAAFPAEAGTLYHDVSAQVLVLDAEAAGRELVTWAESVGGYYLLRSADSVVLRVPAEKVGEVRSVLERVAEIVLAYQLSAIDVREELASVASAIKSREEALELILTYVDQADVEGTLALEQEVSQLVSQLEALEGRKRRLENDAMYARISVNLSSRRQTVPEHRPSSFGWINTVDLYRFLEEALPDAY
jgi:hypothetical protein